MAARLRRLQNDHATIAWGVSKLGYSSSIAAVGGTLDITDIFTDPQIASLLQNGNLVLSADNKLVVEDPDGVGSEKELTSVEEFGDYTKLGITDFTNAQHTHDAADDAGQIVGANALSDASNAGGADKVVMTDASGDLNLGSGQQILGLSATPFSADAAASKAYVDAVKTGLDPKDSVKAASTANLALTGEQTVDGVPLVTGDRILVKDQSTASENGIYIVDSGAWSRAADADSDAEVTSGMYTFVSEGTVAADSGWVLTTNDPIVVGTTGLAFAQFSGAGQITAGTGMTKSGNVVHVGSGVVETRGGINFTANDVAVDPTIATGAQQKGGLEIDAGTKKVQAVTDNSSLEVSATNELQVKDDGVTAAKLNVDTAGTGLKQNVGTGALEVKADSTTGATVSPVTIGANGTGVTVDNDTIIHTAGVLSNNRAAVKGQKMLLTFGKEGSVADSQYLRSLDGIFGSVSTFRMIRDGKISGMSVQCGTAVGTSVDFEVHKNGAVLDATVDVNLTAGAAGGQDDGSTFANNTFVAGDLISVYALNLVGSKPKDVVILVEIELT